MIKNLSSLLSNATSEKNYEARKVILNSLNHMLHEIDPSILMTQKIKVKDERIEIHGVNENIVVDLKNFYEIYVIATGKASLKMAYGAEKLLGDKIKGGYAISPSAIRLNVNLDKIKILYGTHPFTSDNNINATEKILELTEDLNEKSLVLYLLSGGTSALLEKPINRISLDTFNSFISDCMRAGMDIVELNTIRKHLSMVKGGRLAELLYPATVVTLVLSDVIDDRPDTIGSGPTVPDLTTYSEAVEILKKYGLWERAPRIIKEIFLDGVKGIVRETPKPGDKIFEKVQYIILANNFVACYILKRKLNEFGVKSYILSSNIEGEARELGKVFARFLRDGKNLGTLGKPPIAIIMGGETTVTVKGNGIGGRNQEFVLGGVKLISKLDGVAVAAVGTDGIDGNSDAAGAIADGETVDRSLKMGLDVDIFLEENDSYTFFRKLGDNIFTGLTGTNLNDVYLGVIYS
ncbi:MAG: glycerate kinase type-2 family protein [Candidatus Njordarchaeia archaeon]